MWLNMINKQTEDLEKYQPGLNPPPLSEKDKHRVPGVWFQQQAFSFLTFLAPFFSKL
jgi:hypothetical protein